MAEPARSPRSADQQEPSASGVIVSTDTKNEKYSLNKNIKEGIHSRTTPVEIGSKTTNEPEQHSNEEQSEMESISEHIVSNLDSISHDNSIPISNATEVKSHSRNDSSSFNDSPVPTLKNDGENSNNDSEHLPAHSIDKEPKVFSDNQLVDIHNKQHQVQESPKESSWEIPISEVDEVHISSESPVPLPLESSSQSQRPPSESVHEELSASDKDTEHNVTDKSDYELNEKHSVESEKYADSLSDNVEPDKSAKSSESEEMIKLDIRGTAVPKIPFVAEKIIFGPPPEDAVLYQETDIPALTQFLSHFIAGDEPINRSNAISDFQPDLEVSEIFYDSLNPKLEQSDLLIEELTIDDAKEKEQNEEKSLNTGRKSLLPDAELGSLSTTTTDYKTICEEYHGKLVHLEEIVTQREEIIDRLTVSLQRSVQEKSQLELENQHLTNEVQNLQHFVGENMSNSEHTVKGQLSDFMKYETMMKDESTKYFTALMSNEPSSGSVTHSSNGEKDMDREELTVNYSKSCTSDNTDTYEFDEKMSNLLSTLDEFVTENVKNEFKDNLAQLLNEEINKVRLDYDAEMLDVEKQFASDKQTINQEIRRLNELLASVTAGSAELEEFRQQLNMRHEKEMESLRTYFEKKCSDMEKNYTEDVEQSALAATSGGSTSSLEAACSAALPYSSPLRAGGDYPRRERTSSDARHKQIQRKYEQLTEELKAEHTAYVTDLQAAHEEKIRMLEDNVQQLKARLQTAENTEHPVIYQQDIDMELEKERLDHVMEKAKQEVIMQLQEQIQVLLADPAAELSSWPLDLVALRDRINSEAHHTIRRLQATHQEELSQLRAELGGAGGGGGDGEGSADKWRRRRNHTFDQNRQLEEVTKERDGLKRVACTLRRVVTQLVAYCAAAEDELNRSVLTQLLAHVAGHDRSFMDSRSTSPNASALSPVDLDASAVSRGKRVHFAPDLRGVFADMDEEALLNYLQNQDDLSLEIKNELDLSLKRLRQEAHELLDLSGKFSGRPSVSGARRALMLEEDVGARLLSADTHTHCATCEAHRKHSDLMESESLEREGLLRAELRAAMLKLALLTEESPQLDVIAEGYGTHTQPRTPVSLPARPRALSPPPAAADSRSVSLDGSERRAEPGQLARLTRELEVAAKERDDLHMQLEAANRQLRSTRQFVEEQTTERELERDEFARQLAEAREENIRLSQRLHTNARILSEVEQLEAQTRDMTTVIQVLENKKTESDEELKSTLEKISLLRDIITNLETQLEQKSTHETEILKKLEEMKATIDERDGKMRSLLGELESLKSERAEQDTSCIKCDHSNEEDDAYSKLLEKVKEQARWLENSLHRSTQRLERLHEAVCSTCCSESEDVSVRDHRKLSDEAKPADDSSDPPPAARLPELVGVWDCVDALVRAEQAAAKRLRDLEMQRAQLKDIAEEVRAERDVLQQRMSEQALKISSLAARLEVQRTHAEALCHESTGQLSVRLHDALAEVQRLREELESKEKQLTRLRQTIDEEKNVAEVQSDSPYNSTCQPKDKIIILERELASAQGRVAKLEALAKTLESDKAGLIKQHRENQRIIAEKEAQLQELLELKIEDQDNKNEILEGGKNSARTLSDIISISDYDEQDVQMRKVEQRQQNVSVPYPDENRSLNRTLPPDLHEKHQHSSLNIDHTIDHLDLACSPNSLPIYFTSTANKDKQLLHLYKRNINETILFGNTTGPSDRKLNSQDLVENCSMFPNRQAIDSKNISIEPKKINFSINNTDYSKDSKNMKSPEELSTMLDQENFPDILTQLKFEISKSRAEVEQWKAQFKEAEEQLCEFPALKEEVEKLKTMLESSVATMKKDKHFYENQLETFTTTRKVLEQQLKQMSEQVNEKGNDLHLLKEDILRRENMVLELAKEKRNLVNKMTELELKYNTIERKNEILENCDKENRELKNKLAELKKMEQLVSEKNLQIDNLNEHLNRLDHLQRCLDDKNEESEKLKETIEEKNNEIENLQDTMQALMVEKARLVTEVQGLKERLVKLGKDSENSSLQLQKSLSDLETMAACNTDLSAKIEDMKALNDKLKDKECEIEILNEDIDYFHKEIASLKAELKMVSRSPSPRENKGAEDKTKLAERKINADKKELVKIRKHVSLLQHELAFNKKDLNEKAFELARAKLDITELKNNLNQATKLASDREMALINMDQEKSNLHQDMQKLAQEKQALIDQLQSVNNRLREEGNLRELAEKLRFKTEECRELEQEMDVLKRTIERIRDSPSRTLAIVPASDEQALVRSTQRSPTAELECAVRAQLSYSNRLDDSIMEQILSGTSHDDSDEDVPKLQLDLSRSSCSGHSSSSRMVTQLKSENDKLRMQASNLEARLKDKEALITELNRIRDKLVQDWQTAKLQFETEKDNSGRLQLLLDTQKETSDSLQSQDLNMIHILKKRLSSSMAAELELQQTLQNERLCRAQLERALADQRGQPATDDQQQTELNERLKGEVTILKSKLDREKTRLVDLQHMLDQHKMQFQREIESRNEQCTSLKQELAELRRLKHEGGVELMRAFETINQQKNTIIELEKKSEVEGHRSELFREMAALKRALQNTQVNSAATAPIESLLKLKDEKAALREKVRVMESEIANMKNKMSGGGEDKDQAVRFLHTRCIRLESCRKALVWQKRYLLRVLAGYEELERCLQKHSAERETTPRRTFKSVCVAVVGVARMAFLVRRRQHLRTLSADCLLASRDERSTRSPYVSNSPPSRDTSAPRLPRAPSANQSALFTPSANQSALLTPPVQRHLAVDRESSLPRSARRLSGRVYLDPGAGDHRRAADRSLRACSPLVRASSRSSSLCDESTSARSSNAEQASSATLLAGKLDNAGRRLQRVLDSPCDE